MFYLVLHEFLISWLKIVLYAENINGTASSTCDNCSLTGFAASIKTNY